MSEVALDMARDALTEAQGAGQARPLVVASWQRSMEHRVDMEHLAPRFLDDPELDSPLVHAATPIIDALHEQLANEEVGLLLTNNEGVILTRRLTHPGLATRLNRVKLVPGHVFSEESVGTNGIGTALASQRSVLIDGSEHFVEDLREFQCAAVPILHPTRRVVLGTFNLTTMAHTSSAIALALTVSTARQIERELARLSSRREFRLFERYLEACRRMRHLPVLAFNAECVMMNDRLRAVIVGPDQGSLLNFAVECVLKGDGGHTATLPSGLLVELRSVTEDVDDSGHVLSVRVVGPTRRLAKAPAPISIPGVVGGDPGWTRTVTEAAAAYQRRDLVALLGEPGTGKVHLLSAIHRMNAGVNPIVLEAPEEGVAAQDDDWLSAFAGAAADERALVIIRNSHWLSPRMRIALVDRIDGMAGSPHARIAVTANPDSVAPEDELIGLCRTRCEIPPLRHRHSDLLVLARHFLRLYLPRGEHTLTSAAQTALQRMSWPGNVRQLESIMRSAARRASSPDRIDVTDLPGECLANGPVLSPLETIERDAIIKGLQERAGNVGRTARELGIARATLYRKLRRYGIDPSAI